MDARQMKKFIERMALGALTCLSVFLVSCKKDLNSGGNSKESLIVKPGEKLKVTLGKNMLGLKGAIIGAKVTSYQTGAPLEGLYKIENGEIIIQYALSAKPDFRDLLEAEFLSDSGEWIFLKAYIAFKNPTVDFLSHEAVRFFTKGIERSPSEISELEELVLKLEAAISISCFQGKTVPDLNVSIRGVNNALFASEEFKNFFKSRYNKTELDILNYLSFNEVPKLRSAVPGVVLGIPTDFSTSENELTDFKVNITDSDKDQIISEWIINDKEIALSPEATESRNSVKGDSPVFWKLNGLSIKTNFETTKKGSASIYDIKLKLCDGGPAQVYQYRMEVNNASRPPELLEFPEQNLSVSSSELKSIQIRAKDVDGEKLEFKLSRNIFPGVYLSQTPFLNLESFRKARALKGLFKFEAIARVPIKGQSSSLWNDAWLGAARAVEDDNPSTLEFLEATNTLPERVIVDGIGASGPQTARVKFEHGSYLDHLEGEVIRFQIGGLEGFETLNGINIVDPMPINNAALFCVGIDSGLYDSYSLQITCNLGRYPKNLEQDGIWIAKYRCTDKNDAEIATVPSAYNNRCHVLEGVYTSQPGGVEDSQASVYVGIYTSRARHIMSGSSILYGALMTVEDEAGNQEAKSLNLSLQKFQNSQSDPQWDSVVKFKHYLNQAQLEPEKLRSENFSSFFSGSVPLLTSNHSPYLTSGTFAEDDKDIYGGLIRHHSAGAMGKTKPHWWQMLRWEQVDSSLPLILGNADLEVFKDSAYLFFTPPKFGTTEGKILLQAGSSGNFLNGFQNPDSMDLQNIGISKVLSYEVLEDKESYFKFKVLHAGNLGSDSRYSYNSHLWCRGDFHSTGGDAKVDGASSPGPVGTGEIPKSAREPLLGDWILRCAKTENAFNALPTVDSNGYSDPYHLRFALVTNGFVLPEKYPELVQSGAVGETLLQTPSLTDTVFGKPHWKLKSCYFASQRALPAPGEAAKSFKSCGQANTYDSLGSIITLSRLRQASRSLQYLQINPSSLGAGFNPLVNTSFPFSYTHGKSFPGTGSAEVFFRENKIQFAVDGTNSFNPLRYFRYCRYGFRKRGTLWVLSCSQTDSSPKLYSRDSGVVTMEFSSQGSFKIGQNRPISYGAVREDVIHEVSTPANAQTSQNILDNANVRTYDATKGALFAINLKYKTPGLQVLTPSVVADLKRDLPLSLTVKNGSIDVATPAAIFYTDEANTLTRIGSDTIDFSILGMLKPQAGEAIFAWRPGQKTSTPYQVYVVLQNPKSLKSRSLSFNIFANNFVNPPSIYFEDNSNSLPQDPSNVGGYRDSNGEPEISEQIELNGVFVRHLGSELFVKRSKSSTPVDSKIMLRATVDFPAAFFLTDSSGNLVDPTTSNDWFYDVSPFDPSPPLGHPYGSKKLRDNLIKIYDTRGANVTYANLQIASSKIENAIGPEFNVESGVDSAGNSLSLTTFAKIQFRYPSPTHYTKLQLRIADSSNASADYDSEFEAISSEEADTNTAGVFSLSGLDLNFSPNSGTIYCKLIAKYPYNAARNGNSGVDTQIQGRIFCAANTAALKSLVWDSYEDAAVHSKFEIAYTANSQLTTAELKAEFADPIPNFTQTVSDDERVEKAEKVATLKWPQNLTTAQRSSRFHAVIGVFDGTYLFYRTLRVESRAQEEIPTGPVGGTGSCNSTKVFRENGVDVDPVNPDVTCEMARYSHPEATEVYVQSAIAIGGDPTSIHSAYTPDFINSTDLNDRINFNPASDKWDSYNSNSKYSAFFNYDTSGSPHKWVFKWMYSPFAQGKMFNRTLKMGFSPYLQYKRRLFSASLGSDIFSQPSQIGLTAEEKGIIPFNGQRLDYNLYPGRTAETPIFTLTSTIVEKNLKPCAVYSGFSQPAAGTPCLKIIDSDPNVVTMKNFFEAIDGAENFVSLVGDVSSYANSDLPILRYEKAQDFDLAASSFASTWSSIFENQTAFFKFSAYDPNLNLGTTVSNLSSWQVSQKLPADLTVEFPSLYQSNPSAGVKNIRNAFAMLTPKENGIKKTGDFISAVEFTGSILDQESGAVGTVNSSSPGQQKIIARVWDVNQAPQLPGSTAALSHVAPAASTLKEVSFTIVEKDVGDQVKLSVLESNVSETSPSIEAVGGVGSTSSACVNAPCSFVFKLKYYDSAVLKSSTQLNFKILVQDIPWWISEYASNSANASSAFMANFYNVHPDLTKIQPASDQVLEFNSTLSAPAALLTKRKDKVVAPAKWFEKVALGEVYVAPISFFNPLKENILCEFQSGGQPWFSTTGNSATQLPTTSPEFPQMINLQTVSHSTLSPDIVKSLGSVPKNSCLIYWRPTSTYAAKWAALSDSERTIKIRTKVGAGVFDDEWVFSVKSASFDPEFEGNLEGPRTSLDDVTLSFGSRPYLNENNIPLIYVNENESISLTLQNLPALNTVSNALSAHWIMDDQLLHSTLNPISNPTYTFKSRVDQPGIRKFFVILKDNSVAFQSDPNKNPVLDFDTASSPGDYQNKVVNAGYRIFRLNFYVRNTSPMIVSNLSETSNARDLATWTSADGHTLSKFQSLFSVLTNGIEKIVGVFNTKNSAGNTQARAFLFESMNTAIKISSASTYHAKESALQTEIFSTNLLRPHSSMWKTEEACTNCPFRAFDNSSGNWKNDVTTTSIANLNSFTGKNFNGKQVVQELFGSSVVRFEATASTATINGTAISQLTGVQVKSIASLPSGEGIIVRGVQGAEPDRYFYLKSASTPVLYSLTLGSQPEISSGNPSTKYVTAESAGVFLTAKNQAAGASGACDSGYVEFVYLFVKVESQDENIKFGCMNTADGTLVENQNSINGLFLLPLNKLNVQTAKLNLKYFTHLYPRWKSQNSPSTGTFVLVDPNQSTFSTIDLHASPALNAQHKGFLGGLGGARFDALSCQDSEDMCYVADSANKIIWRLK